MAVGLYIHIPFCRQKCFYCDFPSGIGSEALQEEYTEALCREIAAQGSSLSGATVDTVYIGGGTPTALPDELLAKILRALWAAFVFAADVECTVEANPGTVTAEKLQLLRVLGANRLSFGVQSFDDALLRGIGRIHTGQEAVEAIALAKAAGFKNISLDLMYGLPGQALADLEQSVKMALAQRVSHISIYGLQLEEGTAFAAWESQGKLVLPDEALTERMYDYMTEMLPANGYERYEISNFAQKGFASRHNLGYWQDRPYIGIGAAAHSYDKKRRWRNTVDVSAYNRKIAAGQRVSEAEEVLSRRILMEEFCFLALRTKRGIPAAKFKEKFGCSLWAVYGESIRQLQARELLAVDGEQLYLTALGMKYGNIVFAEFLLDEESPAK